MSDQKQSANPVPNQPTTGESPHMEPPYVEPWMRGPVPGVHALLQPVLHSLQQVREDLATWTGGLTTDQLWATPHGFGSVGFHVRHIGRSTDRLLTYALGGQLSPDQLALLKSEKNPGATVDELMAELNAMLDRAERSVRSVDPGSLTGFRGVGRKMLPTTVMGLLHHTAEHAQRHVGQAISAAKLARIS